MKPTTNITIPDQERASTGIDERGVEVGEELGDFEGVLTGVATYRGKPPLLGRPDREA